MNDTYPKVSKRVLPESHPSVRATCAPVPSDTALLRHLAKGMKTALKRCPNGVGVSLPQLGVRLRGFYIKPLNGGKLRARYCFNPSYTIGLGARSELGNEGCLSIDGGRPQYEVRRYTGIDVSYTDERGQSVVESLLGYAARVFQHELDHLDGTLISDVGELYVPIGAAQEVVEKDHDKGFRDSNWKLNLYTCEKGHHTTTVDVDDGVTPFMIGCPRQGCTANAQSSFYPRFRPIPAYVPAPSHEWYSPDAEERKTLTSTLEHVNNGGLLMRERTCATPKEHDL